MRLELVSAVLVLALVLTTGAGAGAVACGGGEDEALALADILEPRQQSPPKPAHNTPLSGCKEQRMEGCCAWRAIGESVCVAEASKDNGAVVCELHKRKNGGQHT